MLVLGSAAGYQHARAMSGPKDPTNCPAIEYYISKEKCVTRYIASFGAKSSPCDGKSSGEEKRKKDSFSLTHFGYTTRPPL